MTPFVIAPEASRPLRSSATTRFDINPNSGEPLNNNRGSKTAENTIYMDTSHPSHIILPVIPAGAK